MSRYWLMMILAVLGVSFIASGTMAAVMVDFDGDATDLDTLFSDFTNGTEPGWDATGGVGGSGAIKPLGTAGTTGDVMSYNAASYDLTAVGETFTASIDFIFTTGDLQTSGVDPIVRLGFTDVIGGGVTLGLFADLAVSGAGTTGDLAVTTQAREGTIGGNETAVYDLEADTWYTFRTSVTVDAFVADGDNQYTMNAEILGIAASQVSATATDVNSIDTQSYWAFRADKVSNLQFLDNFTIEDDTFVIPEPASIGLLGVAAVALLRRRRAG